MANKVSTRQRFQNAIKSAALAWSKGGVIGNTLENEVKAHLFGGQASSSIRLSTSSFYTLWRNHGDIFGAIRELAQSVGVAGFYFENKADKDKDPNPKSVETALACLTRTGPIRAWMREMIRDVEVAGNSYYHLTKNLTGSSVIQLDRIDPRTMIAVCDKYGTLKKWVQKAGMEVVDFEPEEIAHFIVEADPNSPAYGISPMESILWDVRTDLAAMVSNHQLFQNDSVPAAIYVFEEDMSNEEMDLAIESLKRELKGPENRHKSTAVKGLQEIKTVAISNRDMEFTILRRMTTEKICAAYGVPKALLGYTEDVNLANGKEQTQKFWESSVEPLEEQIAEFINRVLLPAFGVDDIKWCFNVRDFDSREWDEASTRADVQLGIMTINEAREKRQLEPYDNSQGAGIADQPIIFGGLSATLLEDVGVDPTDDDTDPIMDEDENEKGLQRLDHLGRKYEEREEDRRNAKT